MINYKKFKNTLFKALPILFMGSLFAQPTVAVLDFAANGLPDYEVETLVERLRSEIPNTKAMRLVDRKMLENILKEQGLQQSGCTTEECAAEIGELLGAQFMISGSVGKLGSTFSVDAKMVSVSTGEMTRTKSVSFDGTVGGLLIEMQILAWEMMDLKPPQPLLLQRAGGDGVDKKVTVAVMDFDPRGISMLEARTLTDRFATELDATGRAILVDRRSMNEVMQEQGFDEAGCTSEECAAEVGALLGVEFMINGAIGKLGDTYTIDAKMFEVATGAASKTKNATYTGPVDGLITEIEILAWEMMGLKAPNTLTKKRKGTIVSETPKVKTPGGAALRSLLIPGWGQHYNFSSSENPSDATKRWLHFGMDAALIALLGVSYQAFLTSDDDAVATHINYKSATDTQQIESYRTTSLGHNEDAKASAQQTNILIFAVAAMHLYSSYDAFTNGPSDGQASNSKKSKFDLVYNPNLKQPELRFSIALD